MSKKNILLAITNGFWYIEQQAAASLGESVASILAGGSFWKDLDKSTAEELCKNSITLVDSNRSPYSANDLQLSNALPNSVAIISIDGPIMKHDNCGDPGTKTFESLIFAADANPNISAIILQCDSPGGTVDGTQSLANVIKATTKPVVTFVDGLMASAMYWAGSSADYIMANSATDRIGSIGTMISFNDMQPVWEKMGVKFHEVYATQSTDKNAAFAEARKNNYDRIKTEMLDPLNNHFVSSVQENRAGKFDIKKENIFTGKVYVASDAVNNGLIDSIGNLNQAIDKAFELAGSPSTQNQPKKNMSKLKIAAFATISVALSAAGFEKPEALDSLNDDHLKALDDKFKALETANADLTAKLADSVKAGSDSVAKITALEASVTEKDTEIATLKAANPGATKTDIKGNEIISEDEKPDYKTEYDEKLAATKAAVPSEYK
jgi:protease-4